MTYPPAHLDALVVAARRGDSGARNELARRSLPMVYNLVRRALHDDSSVDDVVQEILMRAFRQLPELRRPADFRRWLAAIAVRQVSTHMAQEKVTAQRTAPLDEAADRQDAGADVEGPTLLRVQLAGQRRQMRHSAQWMGAGDRAVFVLWWLETAGELERTEVAAALGVSVAHAGVRIQRMREQLELSRTVVAALEAVPGCPALDTVVTGWDGTAGPFWRKRIARHVRSCPVCAPAAGGLVPAERLLAGLALLPVPIALAGAVLTKGFPTAAPWLVRAGRALVSHPVAATVSAGVLAAGVTVSTEAWTDTPPPSPSVAVAPRLDRPSTSPAPAVPLLKPGKLALESADTPGQFIAVADDRGVLAPAGTATARRDATLLAVTGLSDSACFSFRAADGRYLRHSSFRLRLSADEKTVLFRRDATFCARAGALPGSISLESSNYLGYYLRHLGPAMWVDQSDGTSTAEGNRSFVIRPPLD